MTKTGLKNKVRMLLNKPISVWQLAQLVEPRKPYCDGDSIHEKIQYWIEDGFYGVKLHAWQAPGTMMTTLKNYQEFRRKVAEQRKICAEKLLERRQMDSQLRVTIPFPGKRKREKVAI